MSPHTQIQIIAVLAAAACAIPGTFLMLRKMSMIADSITHTTLLGIVIAFFIVQNFSSPFLSIGAALVGIFTVWLTEVVNSPDSVSEDSAIGLVFPFLFSIAIIIISKYAHSVHLCTDSVFLGEIEFAPFDKLILFGKDLGAKAIYSIGAILILNIIYVVLFFKELKIVTFDKSLALLLGFSPVIIHYSLMFMVSMTTVGVFQAVGSILVISLMIAPPASAYLLTEDLKKMMFLSVLIGSLNGLIGHFLAMKFDISIAGSIASVNGAVFGLSFVLSPKDGLIANVLRRKRQKTEFIQKSILYHITSHENNENYEYECSVDKINEHFVMDEKYLRTVIDRLKDNSYININQGVMEITVKGREFIKDI